MSGGTAGLLVSQTVGDGEERCVVVFEELRQGLTLSGYGQGHWEHAA